jgi:non-specific serine/threonine protein kinase
LALTLACAAVGDVEGAEAAHSETLSTLVPEERFQRSHSLLYVGEAFCRRGMIDQALVAVRDSLGLKADMDDPNGLAWTFEVLAEIACETRDYKRATLFLGAASRVCKSMAIDVPTLERQQLREGFRDRLRSAARSATFADDCLRGEQMELEAVIAVALGDGTMRGVPRTAPGLLTAREAEIARLVAFGLTNKQIASKLVIALRTVDAHVQNVLTKLGFHSRAQIAAWVTERSDRPA